jgi:hypothetical protein
MFIQCLLLARSDHSLVCVDFKHSPESTRGPAFESALHLIPSAEPVFFALCAEFGEWHGGDICCANDQWRFKGLEHGLAGVMDRLQ